VLLCRLFGQLPRADVAVIPPAPEHTNLLPFYWEGRLRSQGQLYLSDLSGPTFRRSRMEYLDIFLNFLKRAQFANDVFEGRTKKLGVF
jgi:hypothetical protein